MSLRKTYVDSGVLITAFQGIQPASLRANAILNSSDREFLSSQFVKLEILPKAVYHKQQDEAEFYETFFDAVSHWVVDVGNVLDLLLSFLEGGLCAPFQNLDNKCETPPVHPHVPRSTQTTRKPTSAPR